ncbi:hypothetical protein CEM_041 [Candidatus Johnevansia muelleri]|uniref:Uncharacterized protein n=1 Tax=Candidatus Johnevansia muelleri TaxID=1495769 RepID=A0A078KDN5_9GAMM|nr:hypothetical protein CEM_041 [Candidatus Evansia muelleri]
MDNFFFKKKIVILRDVEACFIPNLKKTLLPKYVIGNLLKFNENLSASIIYKNNIYLINNLDVLSFYNKNYINVNDEMLKDYILKELHIFFKTEKQIYYNIFINNLFKSGKRVNIIIIINYPNYNISNILVYKIQNKIMKIYTITQINININYIDLK